MKAWDDGLGGRVGGEWSHFSGFVVGGVLGSHLLCGF